jgi:hypothetical protein
MVPGRGEGHEQSSAETKPGNLIADAFFRLGCDGLDGSAELLERGTLFIG